MMRTIFMLAMLVSTEAARAGDPTAPVSADISRLRLRATAVVDNAAVSMRDVIDFAAADVRLVEAIAEAPLGVDVPAAGEVEISYDMVNKRLAALGVNRARVLLSGASACTVRRAVQVTETPASDATAPLASARSDAKTTLADLLRARIGHELESLAGTPQVEFEAAGREFLALTSPDFDFTIRSDKPGSLGLREFTVTVKRDGKFQRIVPIGAQVRLARRVLIAARPLNVGSHVSRDALDYAERIFASNEDLGVEHAEQVVGQQVKAFVPAGQLIRSRDLKSVDLVRRSQPVTVEGGGSVGIRITGVALDNGTYGETVRVRLGEGRANRREVRGTVTGVGTVKIGEETL